MEIIGIEKSLYEEIINQIEVLTNQIDFLHRKLQDKYLSEWLDCRQVCSILRISSKTLQTYRETGKIGFSQINRKIYYKSIDVKRMLQNKTIKK
jgi:hypothetical protein